VTLTRRLHQPRRRRTEKVQLNPVSKFLEPEMQKLLVGGRRRRGDQRVSSTYDIPASARR
jgi:hypothetical protein